MNQAICQLTIPLLNQGVDNRSTALDTDSVVSQEWCQPGHANIMRNFSVCPLHQGVNQAIRQPTIPVLDKGVDNRSTSLATDSVASQK